jgi:uncharacterized protein (TIGR02145 family)
VSEKGSAFYNSLSKQVKLNSAINDVIAVSKDGYLDYRCVMYNSDTSGVEIKMIVCADMVRDADGNLYQAVRIGNQVWTVENLRTTKYKDGTAILKVTDSVATPAFCYYKNTTNADSIKKFGALYNWYAVDTKKLAPAGWHVPTDSEWTVMEKYLVLHAFNWDGTTNTSVYNKIAKSLAAKTDWYAYTTTGKIGCDLTMNNRSGFSALPGGCPACNGGFYIYGSYGIWWSSTEGDASDAYHRNLFYGNDYLNRGYYNKSCAFSVRLIRD